MRFVGKAGLITAAASGMGRAGAMRIAAEGGKVAVVDRDAAAAEAVVAEITKAGGTAIAIAADLRDLDVAAGIVAQTVDTFGQLDFAWNHLGHPGPSKVEGMDEDLFQLSFDINVRSVIATTQAALPEMRNAGGGALLYTSSSAGLIGSRYSPSYSLMKHGIVGWTKALALKYAAENIRANVVCPGSIDTPMFTAFGARPDQDPRTPEEIRATTTAGIPMRRLGQPEEVGAAAAFLLSGDASFITGAVLPIDGGFVAQ
ncbi:SDR family oxidoreductase [Pseudooceanicola sp.]|uniref:SDR family NAD(P)-dependent oxidoreductase n=1 Tax=Pseudooceanicola sp. TaxID=1914328 RepID=UPI00260979B1|nr:SDR family oxidoreductase [Pseudooceanicola sp.]MDF1855030.1 SDR family oxidoreductase [Pseudooceanicola sp.]